VREDDNTETLAERVLGIEHRIYPLALALVALDRVKLVAGRSVIIGAEPDEAILIAPRA
jgi:phosphoribosylglycinamide formyltransferase-1